MIDNISPNSQPLKLLLKSDFTPMERTVGVRLDAAWILNNKKFETYQLSEPLKTDRRITISTIFRWEIRGGSSWSILGLPTVSN